jgi:hypothetical protein
MPNQKINPSPFISFHILPPKLPRLLPVHIHQIHHANTHDIPSKPHHNTSTQSRYANTPKQNENENAKKLGAIGIGADTRPSQGRPNPSWIFEFQFQFREKRDMTALTDRMA